jgi:Txe/YoeB family toxin of Txe-Axe toxin-antitoxin module
MVKMSILFFFFLIPQMFCGHQVLNSKAKISETGFRCKTCKRVVMSIQKFLEEVNTKPTKEMGKIEENLQKEFEKLCTYSNVFFDKSFRQAVGEH